MQIIYVPRLQKSIYLRSSLKHVWLYLEQLASFGLTVLILGSPVARGALKPVLGLQLSEKRIGSIQIHRVAIKVVS